MDTSELRNYATIAAAIIALCVFIFNSRTQLRNQRIENISRFFDVHARLFAEGGFLLSYLPAIEAGTFQRKPGDDVVERRFHLMLLQVEQLAILANNHAVPQSTQVYMLGLYAQPLLDLLNDQERGNAFWELAISYLHKLSLLAKEYENLSPAERRRYQR